MSADAPLLAVRGLQKRFGAVRALAGVDLTVLHGQIHVLLGENGAGKSTLIKCLGGVHWPDGGSVALEGRPIAPASPRDAERIGISTVFQEINLIPHMSLAENISLGREPTGPLGRIRWHEVRRRAEVALARLGLRVGVGSDLSSCSIAIRQLVAIARALDVSAKLLILDEPTSSLDRGEVAQLMGVMRRLRADGLGIIFITHFLDQVYEIADRITILRDGALVGEYDPASLPRTRLVSLMIGREYSPPIATPTPTPTLTTAPTTATTTTPSSTNGETAETVAEPSIAVAHARNLGRRGSVEGINIQIDKGQTVGLAGLLGSGRSETARLFFGADRATEGSLEIDGTPVRLRSPRQAIRRRIAMTAEDRRSEGIIPNLSVRENILLALQVHRGLARPIPSAEASRLVHDFVRSLNIKTPSSEAPVSSLSGGNQQKALLARWLATDPHLLILDEPTRGIDVGAKAEIERLIGTLRERGMAVLLVGSDLEEVVRICRRVIVLRDRRQVAELHGGRCNEREIMAAIAEHTPSHIAVGSTPQPPLAGDSGGSR
ncbi:MAG: sugar ABC transporter ATP-binding protein [Phycisphaerales bacterium]|nr:sugar ABC transporter ATP-binding protein [Phycisphaerales bacterium]